MASTTIIQTTDDLDGAVLDSDDVAAVAFGLDGQALAIDLSRRHADELRSLLAPYVIAARPAQPAVQRAAGRRRSTPGSVGRRADSDAIRTWARSAGWEVSAKGRIPAEILQAYDRRG